MNFADTCSVICANTVSDLSLARKVAVGADDVLHFRAHYSVDDYFCRYCLGLDALLFAILPTGSSLTVVSSRYEHATAYISRWSL